MAAAEVTGGVPGLLGPMPQELKEALVDTLTRILSPIQEVQIKLLEVTGIAQTLSPAKGMPQGFRHLTCQALRHTRRRAGGGVFFFPFSFGFCGAY